MLELKVILGSNREGRAADRLLPWLLGGVRSHGGFAVDLLDLRDWPLPFFARSAPSRVDGYFL